MKTKAILNSVYVSVKNMEKSIVLYEQIFGQEVDVYDSEMSVFELDNISLLLAVYDKEAKAITFGNNTVINIQVENIKEALELCDNQKLETVMKLEEIENFSIFQVKDYDGNIIEFYEEKEVGK